MSDPSETEVWCTFKDVDIGEVFFKRYDTSRELLIKTHHDTYKWVTGVAGLENFNTGFGLHWNTQVCVLRVSQSDVLHTPVDE